MPGSHEHLHEAYRTMADAGVTHVICLAPIEEVEQVSPEYHVALKGGSVPWPVEQLPIADFEAPEDRDAFLVAVRRAAISLRSGERVMVHCRAGIGRTGMFAICVLMALGTPRAEAEARVRAAGSGPEAEVQREFIDWIADQLSK
jgi:protein-tyrosine phosphatase